MHDACVRMWIKASSAKPCAATGLGSRQIALLRHEHELGAAGKASCSVRSLPPRLGNDPTLRDPISKPQLCPSDSPPRGSMRRERSNCRPSSNGIRAVGGSSTGLSSFYQLQLMVERLHKASASHIKKGHRTIQPSRSEPA